ncbi:MAG TPA: ArsA family ATPase [Rectinemataceae bacterium]|nr:ArsA family ATPase [Rectinemataceae bacterium]
MEDHREFPGFLSAESWRLLLFSGKGGVGKTTASTATALGIAFRHPDWSILLVSTDPAHSLKDSFAGATPPSNLKVVELDAQACLLAFKEKNRQRLMEIASRGTFLDEEDINKFLELSLPGMDEIMGFLEISSWVAGETYDKIVVDTAPTGHTLRLLGMPDLMRKWLEALDNLLAKYRYMKKLFHGSYQRDELDLFIEGLISDVQKMKRLLKDHRRCQFIPVMLAEALSVEETLDLIRELKRLGIGAKEIVVNRLYPENQCDLCRDIRGRQMQELSRLFSEELFSGVGLWGIPMYPQEIKGLEGLLSFWEEAYPIYASIAENRPPLPFIPPRVTDPISLPPLSSTLLVFAGKGGVGKTTLACATALRLARTYEGKRILLFSADPAHSLSDCLKLSVGPEPAKVAPGLWAMEMDAGAEFASLKNQYQREIKRFLAKIMPNFDMTYDREVMERLMDLSPPGIDELMALTTVIDYFAKGHFDMLVLDTAPTGHLIRLLDLPEIIEEWLKVVFGLFLKYRSIFRLPKVTERLIKISKDLKSLRVMLRDASKTALYAVSILTQMSFDETGDLFAACKRLAISVPGLFLNLATPASEDPLCACIFDRESVVKERFVAAFPATSQILVFRQSDPRGIENLAALGQVLYLPEG